MLKVKGFDYVGENVRSRTFITVAKKLKEIHFGFDNFYNEPNQIKILEGLGSTIPQLALKECLTAILFVKIGNSYGRSRAAQPYADKILSRLTVEDWTVYLEKYIKDETDLLYYIQNCTSTRKNWKEIVKEYDLKSLNLANPIAKSIIK